MKAMQTISRPDRDHIRAHCNPSERGAMLSSGRLGGRADRLNQFADTHGYTRIRVFVFSIFRATILDSRQKDDGHTPSRNVNRP